MPCVRMGNAIVCFNSGGSVKIGNRKYRFELHYWGPYPVDKNDDPVDPDRVPRKFWSKVKRHPAYKAWRKRADERIAKSETRDMAEV
jgi:hypothetical protein